MKYTILLISVYFFGMANCFTQPQNQKGVALIFLEQQKNGGLTFEKINISNNESRIISNPDIITFILPLGEGKAADLIRGGDRPFVFIIKNIGGTLEITIRTNDGKQHKYPSVSLAQLSRYKIRVNVTSGKETKHAYIINNYNDIYLDSGPVLDIFGGKIPMNPDDYSLTIETKILKAENYITGQVLWEKIDHWLVVEGKINNKISGKFIVDTGASGSLVVKKSILPENIEITKLLAVEYTTEGENKTTGQMSGATGKVEDSNFIGASVIPEFEIGDIKLHDISANILNELPEFIERKKIVGIIGLDILRLAKIVSIESISMNSGQIIFTDKFQPSNSDYSLKLENAGNLLFLPGKMQKTDVSFLIDLGARRSLISKKFFTNHDISYKTTGKTETMGISGMKTISDEINVQEIELEKFPFQNVKFIMSDSLFITRSIGLESTGAILGMSFFEQFSNLSIDFTSGTLFLRK